MDYCSCDYDAPEWARVTRPVARSWHHCTECGCSIAPGDKYWSITGKWDGYVQTYRRCAGCLDLLNWVEVHMPCFCDTFGDLIQNVGDAVYEMERDCPGIKAEAGALIGALRTRRYLQRLEAA